MFYSKFLPKKVAADSSSLTYFGGYLFFLDVTALGTTLHISDVKIFQINWREF